MVLEKDPHNEKGLYRRGLAYLRIGELNKAEIDLVKVNGLVLGKDA